MDNTQYTDFDTEIQDNNFHQTKTKSGFLFMLFILITYLLFMLVLCLAWILLTIIKTLYILRFVILAVFVLWFTWDFLIPPYMKQIIMFGFKW